jgi:transposase-like protein
MNSNDSSQDKRAQWNERIKQWEASGKSIAAWCRERAVNENQFYYWRSRLAQPTKPTFVELQESDSTNTGIRVELKDTRICLSRSFDSDTLRRLLAVLRSA